MTQHTITRHIVKLGDGRRFTVDLPFPLALGFYTGWTEETHERITYYRQQVIEAQEITVEVDRDGHRVDERPKV